MTKRITEPAAGQIWESRDQAYEPGRKVKLLTVPAVGVNGFVEAVCVANPNRPHRVGTRTSLRPATLRAKWRIVKPALAMAVQCPCTRWNVDGECPCGHGPGDHEVNECWAVVQQ